MRLRKAIKEGKAADVSFKLPGAPFTSWLTLLFLLSVLVLMAFDYPNGTYTHRGAADYRYFAGYRLVWCAQTRC